MLACKNVYASFSVALAIKMTSLTRALAKNGQMLMNFKPKENSKWRSRNVFWMLTTWYWSLFFSILHWHRHCPSHWHCVVKCSLQQDCCQDQRNGLYFDRKEHVQGPQIARDLRVNRRTPSGHSDVFGASREANERTNR